jgi:hypothetical protein
MLSASNVNPKENESAYHSPLKTNNSQFNQSKKWSNHNGGSNHSNCQ